MSSGSVEELVLKCRSALYQNLHSHSHTLAAQLLAELGRGELGRGICLKAQVIQALDKVLAEQIAVDHGGVETTVQVRQPGQDFQIYFLKIKNQTD